MDDYVQHNWQLLRCGIKYFQKPELCVTPVGKILAYYEKSLMFFLLLLLGWTGRLLISLGTLFSNIVDFYIPFFFAKYGSDIPLIHVL